MSLRLGEQVDAATVEIDLAFVRLKQPHHVFEHHALAAAAGADDHQTLALLDLEIDAVEHDLAAEALGDVSELDERPGWGGGFPAPRGRGSSSEYAS